MKEGEHGSETKDEASELKGGWMERPFMFLGRRGAGEVIGRSRFGSDTLRPAMPDRLEKDGGANVESGAALTGESGDDDGEGSDKSEESVHETVVVGDDSADSVVRVDVLSLCLCAQSGGRVLGRNSGCDSPRCLVGPMLMRFGLTTVTRLWGSIKSASKSYRFMNEGNWSSYNRRVVAEGIFDASVNHRALVVCASMN